MNLFARLRLACLFLALPVLAGCLAEADTTPSAARKSSSGPLNVVCTIGQVGDMARRIGAKHVAVYDLMGAGVDPHLYRATISDTKRLKEADVIFYNGLHLEGRMVEMLENLAKSKPVFAITERIERDQPDRLRHPAEFHGQFDPHIWFDVKLWSDCLAVVEDHLCKLDAVHAAEFHKNAAAYREQLSKLDTWCRERMALIPKPQRVLVTAHDAFGYFGSAYDVEVHGIQGVSTADEADLGHITELVELLVTRKIKAVFVESSVPPKLIESLIRPARARGHKVVKGGELFSDAMGPAGMHEGTYVGMIEHNINTIVTALK